MVPDLENIDMVDSLQVHRGQDLPLSGRLEVTGQENLVASRLGQEHQRPVIASCSVPGFRMERPQMPSPEPQLLSPPQGTNLYSWTRQELRNT